MTAEYVNPFINSTVNVISTMCSVSPIPGTPSEKQGHYTWGIVTGIIGLAGSETKGNMMLSFDQPCVLDLVSKMLMEEHTSLTQDVLDAVGELTNIITGGTKKVLAELGLVIDMSTPIVFSGQGIAIQQISETPIITIPFKTPAGRFVIETNLTKR